MRKFSLFLYYVIGIRLPSMSVSRLGPELRAFLCKRIFKEIGTNVNIASGVVFGSGNKITIGDSSGIGERSRIVAMDFVEIGSNVMIAPEVMILTGNHDYKDKSRLLVNQVVITKPVIINDDVWIGARAIILPGVSICSRVVVAAGSVVSRSIYKPGLYAGTPAKFIKDI